MRTFNLVCLHRECGNGHQAGLTCFMNSETRFQQLGLEFGWPHVNTSGLSFLGKKKKKLRLQAYICLGFQMVKGGGGERMNANSAK